MSNIYKITEAEAYQYGQDAYYKGISGIPIADKDFLLRVEKDFRGKPVKDSRDIFLSWNKGWNAENLKPENQADIEVTIDDKVYNGKINPANRCVSIVVEGERYLLMSSFSGKEYSTMRTINGYKVFEPFGNQIVAVA